MKHLFIKIYNPLQVYAVRNYSEAVWHFTQYKTITVHVILFKTEHRVANFSLYVTVHRISIN